MASTYLRFLRNKLLVNHTQPLSFQGVLRRSDVCEDPTHPFKHLVRRLLHQSPSSASTAPKLESNNGIKLESMRRNLHNGKKNTMFTEELNRQKDLIPRIEKIHVQYKGAPNDAQLELNKGLSTPFDIAQHLSEDLIEQSALALVNEEVWDMGRPLENDCSVELLHFYQDEPFHVNRAFWRSCSFLLGAALESVFKDEVKVTLHSFPAPNVTTGSFVYDVELNIDNWLPTKEELMVISAAMHRLSEKSLPFERLVVDAKVAVEMFSDNKFKTNQIPNIAAKSKTGNSVTLYRAGEHVDISGGPMVGDTSFLGRRCTIASCHKIDYDNVQLYRFQGVALPKGVFLSHYAFGILEKRASRLNDANLHSAKSVTQKLV